MHNFIIEFDKDKKPMYEQLYLYISNEIKNKGLKENERMPSKKALAAHLGISVNTVETAYAILVQEGYLKSVPRSGYYVCRVDAPLGGEYVAYEEKKEKKEKYKTEFRTNAVDVQSFPYSTWIKLSKEVMYANPELLNSGEASGDYCLRESIAKYLHEFRGVKCSPGQIIIGAGIEYLMMLLIELIDRESIYAVENPGYGKISAILTNSGRRIKHISVNKDGIDIDELRKSGADIAYITPSHQFPTGAVMPVGRRMELLSWAEERKGRYIIEDDYNGEFNFSYRPIPAVQGVTDGRKVIYMSTFSRILAPSIRIAYMVLPPKLAEEYNKKFSNYSSTVPRFEQHTLERFISGGYLSRHLNRVKNIYRKRRDTLINELLIYDKEAVLDGENTGLHILVTSRYYREILDNAKEKHIGIYCLDDYFLDGKQHSSKTIIMGYAGISREEIKKSIKDLYCGIGENK